MLTPRQGLLVFFERLDTYTLSTTCQRAFQPLGLMLWDVGRSSLRAVLIGTDMQLLCSYGPLPARWFTVAQSFEQVAKAVQDGVEPPSWGHWRLVDPGVMVRLIFDTPIQDLGTQALRSGASSGKACGSVGAAAASDIRRCPISSSFFAWLGCNLTPDGSGA